MTKQTTTQILKLIGNFIESRLSDCNFVGLSSDGEVFVSFDNDDLESQLVAKKLIKEEFQDHIGVVTTVAQVRTEDLQELVEGLNKALETQEQKVKPHLLDIGKF